uniref:Uncharacterized protein n=1 Tax=Arundo donax TaxID=35708 RepID=A0A0A9QK33_ARUDO
MLHYEVSSALQLILPFNTCVFFSEFPFARFSLCPCSNYIVTIV